MTTSGHSFHTFACAGRAAAHHFWAVPRVGRLTLECGNATQHSSTLGDQPLLFRVTQRTPRDAASRNSIVVRNRQTRFAGIVVNTEDFTAIKI
jgi:hypothetical protein